MLACSSILQYRHSKYAGNHGDVLKHFVYVQVLRLSLLRDTNNNNDDLILIDTHAGIGNYVLENDNKECKDGILRLLEWKRSDLPVPVQYYAGLIDGKDEEEEKALNYKRKGEDQTVNSEIVYSGSPILARRVVWKHRSVHNLSPYPQHFLFEWNPSQFELLQQSILQDQQDTTSDLVASNVDYSDGFQGAVRLVENLVAENTNFSVPNQNRVVVLIDPPFKDVPLECRLVQSTVQKLLEIQPACTIMVWLPILKDPKSNNGIQLLLQELKKMPIGHQKPTEENPTTTTTTTSRASRRDWISASIQVAQEQGLLGSTVWVANPPHGLKEVLEPTVPWLAKCLEQTCSGSQLETSQSPATSSIEQ